MSASSEPVAISGGIMAVVVAGFGLAVLFGAPLSPEQVGGCVTFAGAAIGLVTLVQRSKVMPVETVARRALDAHLDPANMIAANSDYLKWSKK